jgi:hypothetical protein
MRARNALVSFAMQYELACAGSSSMIPIRDIRAGQASHVQSATRDVVVYGNAYMYHSKLIQIDGSPPQILRLTRSQCADFPKLCRMRVSVWC